MASVRRNMSTSQRDGGTSNGESSPGLSSPHKLSYTQNYSPSTLLAFSDFVSLLNKIRAPINNMCSPRASRPLERSKPRGQLWKRAFFHFLICFMIGIFIGMTPFASLDHPVNLGSKHHAFSFEEDPSSSNLQHQLKVMRSVSYQANVSMDTEMANVTIDTGKEQTSRNETSDDAFSSKRDDAFIILSPVQDSDLRYKKLLIVITPAQPRPFQAYYLNRLAYTLRLVPPPLLWIVVEMTSQSAETAEILRKTGVMYRHLVCDANLTSIRHRGVHQRNVALSHIEKHKLDGIVYFAADHNMYKLDLFDQMRTIRRFGTWPVALLTDSKNKVILEGPVCNNSQVIGWHTNPRISRIRRFHVDMSGFAFNSTILWDPKRWHRPTPEPVRQLDKVREGLQGSSFIEQIVEDESQMEGLPHNCSRVMVWHFQMEASQPLHPRGWLMQKNLEVVIPLT
ncbi:probable beta-1,4-xylosyltransferase IRX9H [Aristolochia californica]|uniref:probable beta-1,4-xylosyltransferase IRX9H n=1 Tax=Aristolochia californica TaxID=171875 RepID=UPI0035D6F1C3